VQHYFRLGILCRITTVHNFIIDYRHVEKFHKYKASQEIYEIILS
jgi:hypothetical protein